MNLATRYLGLTLKNPFIAGASPLADDLAVVGRLEDAGAAAIVMRSLFEEQLTHSHPDRFVMEPDRYLEQLTRIKHRVAIPVFASLNGTTAEGWLKYARLLERAGADALEMNFYHVATSPAETSADVERRLIDIVAVM
jgi:dihydroorotate dehydrogenase (fumarate)